MILRVKKKISPVSSQVVTLTLLTVQCPIAAWNYFRAGETWLMGWSFPIP